MTNNLINTILLNERKTKVNALCAPANAFESNNGMKLDDLFIKFLFLYCVFCCCCCCFFFFGCLVLFVNISWKVSNWQDVRHFRRFSRVFFFFKVINVNLPEFSQRIEFFKPCLTRKPPHNGRNKKPHRNRNAMKWQIENVQWKRNSLEQTMDNKCVLYTQQNREAKWKVEQAIYFSIIVNRLNIFKQQYQQIILIEIKGKFQIFWYITTWASQSLLLPIDLSNIRDSARIDARARAISRGKEIPLNMNEITSNTHRTNWFDDAVYIFTFT